jgi:hypothetical protein
VASTISRILILCKTYPSPSGKHVETSCVAGVDASGKLIRLFPVPFRLIGDNKQFKKWQWISARVDKAKNDHRPESHKVFVDTIRVDGKPMPTKNGWAERRALLQKLPIFGDFSALETARQQAGPTLSIVRPAKILGLDITPVDRPEWTENEKAKLLQHQQQAGLFEATDAKSISVLRKLPFDFHYRYASSDASVSYRHKIVDWEIGALFWNCRKIYGEKWEAPFRDKLERSLPSADLMFLMGTIHRFPDQWLIVSLLYPPRPQPGAGVQGSLFDL